MSPTGTSTPPPPQQQAQAQAQAQILTRALLPQLAAIQQLDASDVLECYTLVRLAPLHQPQFNSTIMIQKMALGFVYRPTSAKNHYSNNNFKKQPLELTLEYGPQRTGSTLLEDAMPFVSGEYVTWENEARVYITTVIGNEWKQAYSMASLTGAVLAKLLDRAIVYASVHSRYQPFQVVMMNPTTTGTTMTTATTTTTTTTTTTMQQQQQNDNNNYKLMLKSSSSTDFCYTMWQEMANVGVAIRPILTPPMYNVMLHVESIVKISGYQADGTLVSTQASVCFQKIQDCVMAMATGNYSRYYGTTTTTVMPTSSSPSYGTTPSTVPTTISTTAASATMSPSTAVPTTTTISTAVPSAMPTIMTMDESTTTPTTAPSYNNNNNNFVRRFLQRFFQQVNTDENNNHENNDTLSIDNNDTIILDENIILDDNNETMIPNNDNNNNNNNNNNEGDEALQAVKAAQEAVLAAEDAKNFSSTEASEKAAHAAEAAAAAAQKAADATTYTANQQLKGYLTSGDGVLVPMAIRQCFTNPQYGIATTTKTTAADGSTTNTPATALVYLYLDGSFYYRLNLTDPYVSVVRHDRPLPQTPSVINSSGSLYGGDLLDWTLALAIGLLVGLGLLMIFQQIGIRLLFHKAQKKFFHPLSQERIDNEEEWEHIVQSGSLTFNEDEEDAIPWSMSGRGGASHGRSSKVVVARPPLVLELVESSLRFQRDPDLVDLPDLNSKSKVAVPASMELLSADDDDDNYDDNDDINILGSSSLQLGRNGSGLFQ